MFRDLKMFGRNTAKEEAENVNVVPKPSDTHYEVKSSGVDSTRPPLITIQEPSPNPRLGSALGKEFGQRSKTERTPLKGTSGRLPMRTPEKQVDFSARNKFGWASMNKVTEASEEGRSEVATTATNLYRGVSTMTPRSVRSTGRTVQNNSESNSTQSTPTKSVTKPLHKVEIVRHFGNIGTRSGGFNSVSRGIPVSYCQAGVVNTVDVPIFELREDPSFWMDHNVQVLIRIRPLNSAERFAQGYSRCLKQESAQRVVWIGQPESRFTFDHVACEAINQDTLFRIAGRPLVENCLSGYNSCMFAYGQTGSGKTHTMLGDIDELEIKLSPDRGMTPRIFEYLFARIRAEEDSRIDEKLKYSCKCSFLEIYNEQITDLLYPLSTNLLLREDIKKGVYVENLSEFEVETVTDILKLLIQGASNRKVAATNMNRESSRSHSVFTCVIESRWVKESTTNMRFARLNLVDLAGSERQKTSGAEGERLKEAASINKSLSTLGHVIAILVDIAQGKQRHVPYRDSKLTFLLQDSLGGNSKTTIVANVSPSICCAAETLSTLKFAQGAKLIQNNAVVNEDASGDVVALLHHIRLLKEEVSILRRQNVSRCLSFHSTISESFEEEGHPTYLEESPEDESNDPYLPVSSGTMKMSFKQLKSLESTLAGALRREQMTDASVKQLEAEIEHLNRLVRQREEDTQSTKMMLRFREDKIRRMESLLGNSMPSETYLMEENKALSEEVQVLQARVDRNPEVIRFALENIRLLDKLRRFQDFYEEGEREILIAETSEMRNQLLQIFNSNIPSQDALLTNKDHDSSYVELKRTQQELEDCKNSLNSCLEINSKLTRDINDLQSQMDILTTKSVDQHINVETNTVYTTEVEMNQLRETFEKEMDEILIKHTEEVMHLELELDILKIILQEEKQSLVKVQEQACCLSNKLEIDSTRDLNVSAKLEDAVYKLKVAESIIEALESQQIISITEFDDLKVVLDRREQEVSVLKEKLCNQEPRKLPCSQNSEIERLPLQLKLKKMQDSLDKAKRVNVSIQRDQAHETSHELEIDEVCRQVEAETADVIICLQEELSTLQKIVQEFNIKEMEAKSTLRILETELKGVKEKLCLISKEKESLAEQIGKQVLDFNAKKRESVLLEIERDEQRESLHSLTLEKANLEDRLEQRHVELSTMAEDWEKLAGHIGVIMANGHGALNDASEQADSLSSLLSVRNSVNEQVGNMVQSISEKDMMINKLRKCLEEAQDVKSDMEGKLRSLKGAALAITEAQHQESSVKEKEVLMLTTQLHEKMSAIKKMNSKIDSLVDQVRNAEVCATVAFVIVKRLSEKNSEYVAVVDVLERHNRHLMVDINVFQNKCAELTLQLTEVQENVHDMETQLQEVQNNFLLQKKNHCEEISKKDEELALLTSRLCGSVSIIKEQDRKIKMSEDQAESDILMKTKISLDEFKSGVSTLNSCMSKYTKANIPANVVEQNTVKDLNLCANGEDRLDRIESIQAIGEEHVAGNQRKYRTINGVSYEPDLQDSRRTCKNVCDSELTIHLVKKQLEAALESFQSVKSQMFKLFEEKEESIKSAEKNWQTIECLSSKILLLQTQMSETEKLSDLKLTALGHKLKSIENKSEEARENWFHDKEVLELQLRDSKDVIAQKSAEASRLLEEAQLTMKEADAKVNVLMLVNEDSNSEIKRLRETVSELAAERDFLLEEVKTLNFSADKLQRQFSTDLSIISDIVTDMKITHMKEFESIYCDISDLNSHFLFSINLIRLWFEDVWSEIIVKDCAVSVLHLCYMGVLLEAATGLNVENSFLHHGLCESNSLVVNLKEHNAKAKKELEMCRTFNRKLLSDIKRNFDCISRKVDETGRLSMKLTSFEKRILDLQLQEETMLVRSNSMASELSLLLKELDLSIMEKDVLSELQAESSEVELTCKDFEAFIFASELKEMVLRKGDLEIQIHSLKEDLDHKNNAMDALKEENILLQDKLLSVHQDKGQLILLLRLNEKFIDRSVQTVDMMKSKLSNLSSVRISAVLDNSFEEICENKKIASRTMSELACVEEFTNELISENLSLQKDLSRLQESAFSAKIQRDKFEQLVEQMEINLGKKTNVISALELDIAADRKSLKSVLEKNSGLTAQIEDLLLAKCHIEEELTERIKVTEGLDEELCLVHNALGQTIIFLQGLNNDLNKVSSQKDHLDSVIVSLKERLDTAESLAVESEAIAIEARQIAESKISYAEDKEQEAKLLERSVEELESTVGVLEEKLETVIREAERQRSQREEIEIELQSIKHQMHNIHSSRSNMNADFQRHLEMKETDLKEAQNQIQILQKHLAEKDSEISQFRIHISELNLHADAQAREYNHKFKTLESMAERVKLEILSSHGPNSSSTKSDKNSAKSRGSSSPFKCIGLGLAQQINSEKDEELTDARARIEELKKEIFRLNARIACADSMTHDVIRDLLGIKLDFNNYAHVERMTENSQIHNEESYVKELEIDSVKQKLNEFIKERRGWLEEINRKRAELVAAQVALEELQQQDQLLTTENEMLKADIMNYKKKVLRLEDEVKKISGQQNLQQRIHHHAKIKEENNMLKNRNADLGTKLQRAETRLTRVKEELARYCASNGMTHFHFDEEKCLNNNSKNSV